MSFAGFLATVGILFLLYGIIIGLEPNESIFNPLFWVGVVLIGLAMVGSIMASARMARLRDQYNDGEDFSDNTMQSAPPVSGTTINQQPVQQQPRTGKCPSCGGSGSGEFCAFCGTRMN